MLDEFGKVLQDLPNVHPTSRRGDPLAAIDPLVGAIVAAVGIAAGVGGAAVDGAVWAAGFAAAAGAYVSATALWLLGGGRGTIAGAAVGTPLLALFVAGFGEYYVF